MATEPSSPACAVLGRDFGLFYADVFARYLATGVAWPWKIYVSAHLPAFMLATYSLLYGVLPRVLRAQQGVGAGLLLAGWVVASAVLSNLLDALYIFGLAPALFNEAPDEDFQWANVSGDLHLGFSRCC